MHSLKLINLILPENPMNRGDWLAIVHRVTKIQTRLKRLSIHTQTIYRRHKRMKEGKKGERILS